MSIRLFVLLLLFCASPLNAFSQKMMPISELRSGGFPKSIRTITLSSGKPILVVMKIADRSKSIFKMLDYKTGQPVTFRAKEIAIASIEDNSASTKLLKKHLTSSYSFILEVHPIRDGKYIGSESRHVIIITSKGALDSTSPSMRLESAYKELSENAKNLVAYQNRKVKPLSYALADAGNDWNKFSKQDELLHALRFVETRRNRIESLSLTLLVDSLSLPDGENETAQTEILAKEIDDHISTLKIFHHLHKELERKVELKREFVLGAAKLSSAIEAFQRKQRKRRNSTIDTMVAELELLSLKADMLHSDQAFRLHALSLKHSIAEQELEEYQEWLEAEEAAREEQVAQEYYNRIDYGGDLNNFQLMHQTSRMQFNFFYSKSWDHRPATDGRQ